MSDRTEYYRNYYMRNKTRINVRNSSYRKNNLTKIKKHYNVNRIKILAKQAKYQRKNKSNINNYHRKYFKLNPDKAKGFQLKYKYGISLQEYNLLLDTQGNRCAICDKHISKMNRAMDVDHNHITGRVRGLLCSRCNKAIGLFEDNKELLIKAVNYFDNH